MSYALKMEERICHEALLGVPRRLEALVSKVNQWRSAGGSGAWGLPDDLETELTYLERITARSVPRQHRQRAAELAEEVAKLRNRVQDFEEEDFAAAQGLGGNAGERRDVGGAARHSSTLFPPGAALVSMDPAVLREGPLEDSPELEQLSPGSFVDVIPQTGAATSEDRMMVRTQGGRTGWVRTCRENLGRLWRERNEAGSLAAFLRPSAAAAGESAQSPAGTMRDEDEVRVAAAEGRLVGELNHYPMLASADSAVILRSWSDADQELSSRRDRQALLELERGSVNLMEVIRELDQLVDRDQSNLDQIEHRVEETREHIEQGVAVLAESSGSNFDTAKWLAPLGTFAVVGGALLLPLAGPGASAAGVAKVCFAVRGAMAAGAAGASWRGACTLSKWQRQVLEDMKDQLPRAFEAIPESDILMLQEAGIEAEQRLTRKLRDIGSWSASTHKRGLGVLRRPSDLRKGGYAFSTAFNVDMEAWRVFQLLRSLQATGSLDPGCGICWSRPVGADATTHVRYLAFSKFLAKRDFFVICRTARVEAEEGDGASEFECYSIALASVPEIMLKSGGLPQPQSSIQHGQIHVLGVLVTAMPMPSTGVGDGGGSATLVGPSVSKVELMVDLDPSLAAPNFAIDMDVRQHLVDTALHLSDALKMAASAPGR